MSYGGPFRGRPNLLEGAVCAEVSIPKADFLKVVNSPPVLVGSLGREHKKLGDSTREQTGACCSRVESFPRPEPVSGEGLGMPGAVCHLRVVIVILYGLGPVHLSVRACLFQPASPTLSSRILRDDRKHCGMQGPVTTVSGQSDYCATFRRVSTQDHL